MGHGGKQPDNWAKTWRAWALAPAAGLCLALLTACGGGPTMVAPATSAPPTGTPLPATPTVTAPATPLPHAAGLGDIQWSDKPMTAATPVPGVTQLTSDVPFIVANVPAYALQPGSQVSAAWTYNNTSLDAFSTTLTIDTPQAEEWLTFQLSRNTDTAWPTGTYEITISLNGQVAQSAALEVIP